MALKDYKGPPSLSVFLFFYLRLVIDMCLSYLQVMIQLTQVLSCTGTLPAISVCIYYLYRVTELT